MTERNTVGGIWEYECRTFCSSNVNLVHHPEIHLYVIHNNRRAQINDNHVCIGVNPNINPFQQADTRDTRQEVLCLFSIMVLFLSSDQI